MSPTSQSLSDVPSVAEANEAIRRFVADRTSWTQGDLAQLDLLRTDWQRAVRNEIRPIG
ncbi:MAG: hypothetical protein ACRDP3_28340 [Streptomyces sp.]|uniref:hypothetical protein n=1 Tax=Streptomyces sp. TaxID=1931 RepID=UPI003D6B31C9